MSTRPRSVSIGLVAAIAATSLILGPPPATATPIAHLLSQPPLTSQPIGLRVNNEVEPLGIDDGWQGNNLPTFSWAIDVPADERGVVQTGYRIQVGPSPEFDVGELVWDTQTVESASNSGIVYAGRPLESGTTYYWRVVSFVTNRLTPTWSDAASFETALLSQHDWDGAAWVTAQGYVRRSFTLGAAPQRARLYIAGTAAFRLTINGHRADDAAGEPVDQPAQVGDTMVGAVREDKSLRISYRTYDVTALMTAGTNVIGVEGAGYVRTAIRAVLVTSSAGVASQRLVTDTTWMTHAGPTALAGPNGEQFDAAAVVPRWDQPITATATAGWAPTSTASFSHTVNAAAGRPVTTTGGSVETDGFSAAGLTDGVVISRRGQEGYLSSPATTAATRRSVTVDLGAPTSIEAVRFYPSEPSALVPSPAFGQPAAYTVEVASTPDFAQPTTVPSTVTSPFEISRTPKQFSPFPSSILGRYVRVTATKLGAVSAHGPFAFAAAELTVWTTAPAAAPVMVAAPHAPIRVTASSAPVAITQNVTIDGVVGQLVDFGTTRTGVVQLDVPAAARRVIGIRYGEGLVAGSMAPYGVSQVDKLTTADNTAITWSPELTYYGHRYVLVTGYPGVIAPSAIRSLTVDTDLERTSTFASDNPTYNSIHEMMATTIANTVHDLPEDNPDRERRGWWADAQLASGFALQTFDVASVYRKFVDDAISGQMPNAYNPDAPAGMIFDNTQGDQSAQYFFSDPAWSIGPLQIAWNTYVTTGDIGILRQAFPMMQAWVDFESSMAVDGMIVRVPSDHFWGDWTASVDTAGSQYATAFYRLGIDIVAKSATVLGRQYDIDEYTGLRGWVDEGYNARYLDPVTHVYTGASALAQALPLALGMVPAANRDAVAAALVQRVQAAGLENNGGILSSLYVPRALDLVGRGDIVAAMLAKNSVPATGGRTLAAMAADGPGTVWEYYSGGGSLIQPALGSPAVWFVDSLAGIRSDEVDAGFGHILISPTIVTQATWVEATQATNRGTVRSRWQRSGAGITLDVDIPVGSTATVRIPTTGLVHPMITEGGTVVSPTVPPTVIRGITVTSTTPGAVTLEVGSGSYHFATAESLVAVPGTALTDPAGIVVDDADPRITYSSAFVAFAGPDFFPLHDSTLHSGYVGDTASLACARCTGFALNTTVGNARGIVRVQIDDRPPVDVDLNRPYWAYQQQVWVAVGLPAGPHAVRFVGVDKNPLSAFETFEIDSITVFGE